MSENNLNNNELQDNDFIDSSALTEVYIEYPDGTVELKKVAVSWEIVG